MSECAFAFVLEFLIYNGFYLFIYTKFYKFFFYSLLAITLTYFFYI